MLDGFPTVRGFIGIGLDQFGIIPAGGGGITAFFRFRRGGCEEIGQFRALIDEVTQQLMQQGVPYLRANAVRRNQNAMKLFRGCGFEWVRTDCYLLGRDM